MLLKSLKIIAGVGTVITGLISLFWPLKVPGFTGLEPIGGRGITEIRTILGALFVALGGAVLFFSSPESYRILGITYLGMALVRGASILIDKSAVNSNLISLFAELIFGLVLVL